MECCHRERGGLPVRPAQGAHGFRLAAVSRRLAGRIASCGEGRPAGPQGLAVSVSVGVGYVTLGMGAPKETAGFVQGSAVAGAGGGREELISEHRCPFRDPPIRARTVSS